MFFSSSALGSTPVRKIASPPLFRLIETVFLVLADSWEQCQDADVLLESPSAMAGVHIAEALRG